MTTALNIAAALAFAALLAAGTALDDHSADWQHSNALLEAQKQAQEEARREAAAAALCQQHGEADYQWDASGALWCVPRRGRVVLAGVRP